MDKTGLCGIVLAGGFGSRLAPLTDTLPKPLVKILGKSVLQMTIEKLYDAQVKDIAISCHCKSQIVQDSVKNMKYVRCVHESVPMGTAGGAKMCIGKDMRNAVVLSGDGIFDFNLGEILRFHEESNADVTLVTTTKENPTELGVVVADESGNILEILEKPSWQSVVSNVVNTGIYVIKERVFNEIPDNVPYDFSRDLFPKLLKNGYKLKTITLPDYWCDIGTLDEYLRCNMDGCKGKITSVDCAHNDMQKLRHVGIQAKDEVFLGENVTFGSNVVLENGFVTGDRCHIDKNCRISESVFFDDVNVGAGCGIYRAIIGNGVTVEDNCIIPEGCVIADGCTIREGTVLDKNTVVNSKGEQTERMSENNGDIVFEKDGTVLLKGDDIYKTAEKFGVCLVEAICQRKGRAVQVGAVCDGCEKESWDGFVSGCIKAGADVFHFMDCDVSLTKFASEIFPCDVTVCVSSLGHNTEMEIYLENMEKCDDFTERKILKMYGVKEALQTYGNKSQGSKITIQNVDGIYGLYVTKAIKTMLGNLPSLSCKAVFENIGTLRHKMQRMSFEKLCCVEKVTEYIVKNDGEEVEIVTKNGKYDYNHIRAAVLLYSDVIGMDKVYVDEEIPEAVKYMLSRKSVSFVTPESLQNPFGRDNVLGRLVCHEEGFCICALMCILSLKDVTLDELMSTIPNFEVYTDIYVGSKNRAGTMARLCRMYGMGERKSRGVTVKLSGGNVTVIPQRIQGFKIISEATSMETAKELCHRIENAVLKEN